MGISMSSPQVGASFSSPQLGDGPVLVSDPDAIGPFTSAFTVDPSDTNYLGFSASMSSMGTIVQAQYTDTANVVRTATCSAQIISYSTYTDFGYDFEDGLPTPTTVTGINSYGSILCPIANTQIGTGPLVLSLTGDGDESQSFGPSTYALYVGRTTATVSPEPSTTTSVVPVVERPFVSSGENATFSNSSSVSSSSTTLVPTTVLGYGPPTIYSVPTVTITTSLSTDIVYVTGDHAILPTTTIMVSLGTTTVTTNSTVTIDQRTLPTTCISDFNSTTVTLSARSLTCTNLKLHTAFLWVMMEDPFDFCAYYLTANRNTSPLLEMSASTLKDTCSCLVTYKSAPLPVFKVGSSYSPKPKRQCNRSVASLIQAKFKEPKTFCKYYTSTSRNISPFSTLKPGDVFAGCSCLI
ncbi:hypothetical protein KCU92_g7484, partial [Aureobasidium melanogenum]